MERQELEFTKDAEGAKLMAAFIAEMQKQGGELWVHDRGNRWVLIFPGI